MINSRFDQQQFSQEVINLVAARQCSYLDAVISLCETKEIDPAAAASLLTKPIIDKLQAEAIDLHLLPQQSKLPL